MASRVAGLLLFLPVPIVLVLLTRAPLGPGRSLALALLLIVSHPLYARRFALRRGGTRCLWCGGPARGREVFAVVEPAGDTRWHACAVHAPALRRALGWMDRGRVLLRIGVGLPLLTLIAALGLAAADRGELLPLGWSVRAFQIGIAVTVLAISSVCLLPAAPLGRAPRTPFPLHVPALIGMAQVLWLFRVVGVLWLYQGLMALAG